jgi:hypothetical protein
LKLQEKHSALKREHPVLKNMKILDVFIFLWVIFTLLDPDADPDPATQINPDPRIRIRNNGKKHMFLDHLIILGGGNQLKHTFSP